MSYRVATIIGSLSGQSINRAVFGGLQKLAPEVGLDLVEVPIKDLPLFNVDLEPDVPPAVATFKEQLKAADAVLVLTPEYNRSYPGVLKNALDWSSRPAGDSALAGKPGAVAGVSPGAIGTALAQVHLRSLLDFLGVPLLARSEVYIQYKDGYLTDDGQIADPRNAQFLTGWLAAFAAHIARYAE